MAKHEFGIMQRIPGSERYNAYEPEKYSCISIDDEYIEPLMPEFEDIPCYWHTLSIPQNNLDYCGITIIPPMSATSFIAVFKRHGGAPYERIISLFEQAIHENKYIIHYGL